MATNSSRRSLAPRPAGLADPARPVCRSVLVGLAILALTGSSSCVITKVITEPADAALDADREDAALPDAALSDAALSDAARDARLDARPGDAGRDARIRDAAPDADQEDADIDGSTTCPTGWKLCHGECRNIATDPKNCGDCDNDCGPGGYCLGTCQCLPGLTWCDGHCVDISSNPNHCGGCGLSCPQSLPHCAHFNCTMQDCNQLGGYEGCDQDDAACVRTDDMERDPLHCSGCDQQCDSGQFCIQSECVDFTPAPDCTTCPCQDCGSLRCCMLGGPQLVVCVDGNACP